MERLPLLGGAGGRTEVLVLLACFRDVVCDGDSLGQEHQRITAGALRHAGVVAKEVTGHVSAFDQWRLS